MTRKELFKLLESFAIDYRKIAIDSIRRNRHMNEVTLEDIQQTVVDALLVDFINYIASENCCDLGLYTHYITYPK
jgi:hypothetical protein